MQMLSDKRDTIQVFLSHEKKLRVGGVHWPIYKNNFDDYIEWPIKRVW